MTNSITDHTPRDIGTALASTIAIIFISTIIYSGVISEKHRIHSLKHSTWYEIQLSPAQSLEFHILEFRTGDISLYLDHNKTQIYEQPCAGFKTTCKALGDQVFELQNVVLYSNEYMFHPASHFVLKSITFLDNNKQQQTLDIQSKPPNHPQFIQAEKSSFAGSMLMTFFVFSMFSLLFYLNHLGRYLESIETINFINKGIITYYVATVIFVISQYFIM